MCDEKRREFSWPVRVYYEDTDAGGVVYYANYLKFMERARTECLRSIGFEQDRLRDDYGILFAVHSVEIRYRKPARFNDELEVITRICHLGKASLVFRQSIHLAGDPASRPLCTATVKVVCLNAERFSAQGMPATVLQQIRAEFFDGS